MGENSINFKRLGRNCRGRAFTFIELVLVISLLSVAALLFVSYTGDIGNVAVDSASWKLQSDLRYAQQMATSTGLNHGVKFVQNGNYTVYAGDVSTPITDPLDRNPMIEEMSQFGSVWLNNSLQVEFDKVGKPVMGGGEFIEIVADSGAARKIYVIDNTGAIIVDVLGYGEGCSCRMCGGGRK